MDESSVWYWLNTSWVVEYFSDVYEFERPWVKPILFLLPVVLVFRFLYFQFVAGKLKTAQVTNKLPFDFTALLAVIPSLLFVLSMEFMLMALSGPLKTNEKVETWTEGIDIMLAIDISQSMEGMDFKPNRLEAAKKIATDFIDGRKGDRIGVIEFRGEAFSKSPVTGDYELLKEQIKEISFQDIANEGTAIGLALATAVNRIKDTDSKSKVVIILSDGEQTAGNIEPQTAAALAYSFGVKVYTIGLGKDGKVPYMQTYQYRDFFTGKVHTEEKEVLMDNNFNEKELKEIAQTTKGKYFRATSNNSLKTIFKEIDEMEKHEIKEDRYKSTKNFYEPYLLLGMACFLLWLFTKSTFLTSALHD